MFHQTQKTKKKLVTFSVDREVFEIFKQTANKDMRKYSQIVGRCDEEICEFKDLDLIVYYLFLKNIFFYHTYIQSFLRQYI